MARKYSRKKKILIITLSILALLIAVRLTLPYVVLHYANKTLDEMDGYRGHIKDIDLAIIRGAYKIDSRLDMKMKLNPLAEDPTFDLNAEWKNTNLVKLNEFFQAYAKVDVNKGTFGLYTEVAAKEGSFTGYVKPLIKDIDVLGKEDRKGNILRKVWEGVTGTVTEIFENQSKETFATKIPLKGEIKNPKANI